MRKRIRIIILVSTFIVFIVVSVAYLYFREIRLPASGSLAIPGLHSPAEIITDSHGYRHIYANSDADLYRALGYLHAADFLPVMDNFHRAANGTLAEVYGPSLANVDLWTRRLGFAAYASKFINQTDSTTKTILNAYCNGINSYIQKNHNRLHRHFKRRHYSPAVWQPTDCLAIQRLLAWTLSNQLIKKSVFYKLLEMYGKNKILAGFPALQNFPPDSFPQFSTQLFSSLNEILDNQIRLLDFLNISAENLENSWVLSARFLTDNNAVMGGEPPAFLNRFKDIVELNSPNLNIAGLVIPGIPIMIFGHNPTIAWNLTIRPADNLELILYPLSDTKTRYRENNQWQDFQARHESIITRSGNDTSATFYSTVSGPVIGTVTDSNQQEFCIAILWKGFEFSDDLQSYTKLYHARSWESFKTAVAQHIVPAAEVDYLDVEGNIGTAQYVSDLDIYDNTLLLPTFSRIYQSDYIRPVHHLFRNLNPLSGSIRHYRQFPDLVTTDTTASGDIFNGDTVISYNDIIHFQLFPRDRQAELLLPFIFETISESDLLSPVQHQAYAILKRWDLRISNTDPAVTIFNTFLDNLRQRVYRDELDLADPQLSHQFELLTEEAFLNLLYLLQQGESEWFDDIRSITQIEHRKIIVLRAFFDTIDFLTTTYSRNIGDWCPESTIDSDYLNRINVIQRFSPEVEILILRTVTQPVMPFSRHTRIQIGKEIFYSNNRAELIRDNAEILTLLPQ